MTEQKRPLGLTIFAWLLICTSTIQIHTLLFFSDWYRSIYSYWPDWLFYLRYCFSWFQRILGIYIAIGFLNGNELARKLAIALGVFTISTLYWKHHYPAFLQHCQLLDARYHDLFLYMNWKTSFVQMCIPSLIAHCLVDILFCGSMIYYVTRPSVKKYFQAQRP